MEQSLVRSCWFGSGLLPSAEPAPSSGRAQRGAAFAPLFSKRVVYMKSLKSLCASWLIIIGLSMPVLVYGEADASDEAYSSSPKRVHVLRRLAPAKKKVRYCHGGVFQPCVCWQDVTKNVSYRPSEERCGKSTYPGDKKNYNAAVLLRGNMKSSFSTVVRDYLNNDRSPYEPALCSYEEYEAGLTKCSRWKGQYKFADGKETVLCLGASGYSTVFKTITRITIKISNYVDPITGEKPLARLCLRKPWQPLN